MMSLVALFWIGLTSLLVATFAGIGSRVLRDFSRRELELYCRSRKRELFDVITTHHDRVALGADTVLVASLLGSVLAGGVWVYRVLDGWWPLGVAGLGMLLLATVVWIPLAVTRFWSAPVVFRTWIIWRYVAVVTWPLLLGSQVVDSLARRLTGRDRQSHDEEEEAFEDEIRTIVNAGWRDGLLEEDAREMIEGVIELGDVDVADIMTPRSRIDALDASWSWPQILDFLVRVKRTRLPVYRDSLDNVVGVLYAKDLLATFAQSGRLPQISLDSVLREAWFIPSEKKVDDLLNRFLETRNHMAIVVDEYKAVRGVVTIEDALEEIVGEIQDEHEYDTEPTIQPWTDNRSEVMGDAHLEEIGDQLGVEFPEQVESDTIGGFVVEHFGRIPKERESLACNDVTVTVVAADRRRVLRVQFERLERVDGRG